MSINRTWLDAEPHLLQALRRALPDVDVRLEVDAPANTADLSVPCVLVRYTGYRVRANQVGYKQAALRADWQALVIDRHGPEIDPAGPARARIADLCARTLSAVMGLRIPGFPQPVQLTESSGSFVEAGLLYHPTAFSLEFVAASDAT